MKCHVCRYISDIYWIAACTLTPAKPSKLDCLYKTSVKPRRSPLRAYINSTGSNLSTNVTIKNFLELYKKFKKIFPKNLFFSILFFLCT